MDGLKFQGSSNNTEFLEIRDLIVTNLSDPE